MALVSLFSIQFSLSSRLILFPWGQSALKLVRRCPHEQTGKSFDESPKQGLPFSPDSSFSTQTIGTLTNGAVGALFPSETLRHSSATKTAGPGCTLNPVLVFDSFLSQFTVARVNFLSHEVVSPSRSRREENSESMNEAWTVLLGGNSLSPKSGHNVSGIECQIGLKMITFKMRDGTELS
jgi:hypothetical protein